MKSRQKWVRNKIRILFTSEIRCTMSHLSRMGSNHGIDIVVLGYQLLVPTPARAKTNQFDEKTTRWICLWWWQLLTAISFSEYIPPKRSMFIILFPTHRHFVIEIRSINLEATYPWKYIYTFSRHTNEINFQNVIHQPPHTDTDCLKINFS